MHNDKSIAMYILFKIRMMEFCKIIFSHELYNENSCRFKYLGANVYSKNE